jgi:hypothetical protein
VRSSRKPREPPCSNSSGRGTKRGDDGRRELSATLPGRASLQLRTFACRMRAHHLSPVTGRGRSAERSESIELRSECGHRQCRSMRELGPTAQELVFEQILSAVNRTDRGNSRTSAQRSSVCGVRLTRRATVASVTCFKKPNASRLEREQPLWVITHRSSNVSSQGRSDQAISSTMRTSSCFVFGWRRGMVGQ